MEKASTKWWVLSAVACGTFMATLDASIVNIALPTLTKSLNTDMHGVNWVIATYFLVITCLLLPFGRLSDLYGRKKVFLFGYFVFTLGSIFCGVSTNLSMLIVSRAIKALGAAMLMANGPAIITAAFPAKERGKALGTLAMVVSAGLISGPSVGGMLISLFGWRSIFLLNIPVGLLGGYLVSKFIEKDHPIADHPPFDWAGAILQFFILLLFIIVFDPPYIAIFGDSPLMATRVAALLIALSLTVIFLRAEKKAQAPLFDLDLIRDRTFFSANLSGFLTFVSYSSVTVLMPFFLEEKLFLTTDQAGIIMTVIPIMILVTAPISGRLSDQLGCRGLSFSGALVGTVGLLFLSGFLGAGLHENMRITSVILMLAMIGLGLGLFQSPNNNAIMGCVSEDKLGTASAILATMRNLGLVVGTGFATGFFTWYRERSGDFTSALHLTHLVAAAIGVVATLSAFVKEPGIQGRR